MGANFGLAVLRISSFHKLFFGWSLAACAALALAAYIGLKWHWLVALLVGVNATTLGLYGYDKRAAQTGRLRVPESVLHLWAFLGGSPGALLGQRLFRHKTAKRPFQILFWGIFLAQAALLTWYLLRW